MTRPLWGFRIGRLLQLLGLVIGLEALLVFGSEPSEGPMIYVTTAAVAVFAAGWWLVRRYKPVSEAPRK
ncbi:MAG: hypothetical protein HY304_08520 [candidate division Zixibacteria bacterium]|nr:hypothetical protein [candidate division Zixibacteria bacterium]